MSMNREVRDRWVAALRSGEYRRGIGKLRRYDGLQAGDGRGPAYCCLGVLCELAVEAGVVRRVLTPGLSTSTTYVAVDHPGDRSDNFLPAAVLSWAELLDPNPRAGSYTLADWNDDRHATFEDVAHLIEEHL